MLTVTNELLGTLMQDVENYHQRIGLADELCRSPLRIQWFDADFLRIERGIVVDLVAGPHRGKSEHRAYKSDSAAYTH